MAENATLFFAYNKLLSAVRSFDRGKTQYDLVPYTLPQVAIAAAGAGAITSYVL
jgi:ornithine carrier protein